MKDWRPSIVCGIGAWLFGLLLAATAAGQLVAFPGADGAGRLATGGRGGAVYHVTSLAGRYNDPNRSAPGTLAYGLSDANFTVNGVVQPRTIVFDVGGTIDLGSWDTQCRLNIGSNVTLAGETAPGGIAIIGGVIKVNGANSIIRNLTVAPGYGNRGIGADGMPDSYVYDAFDISGRNIVIDHCSTFFATDEHISANELADRITVQYTNISQGQNYPNLDTNGSYTGHAFGSLFQMGSGAQLSVHHNLYAHQKGRLPRVGSSVGTGAINDFRNNVFYNWLGTAGTGASGQPSFNNFVGNFFLAGPGGENPVGGTSTAITTTAGGTGIFAGNNTSGTRVYQAGNLKDTNKDGDPLDVSAVTNSNFSSSTLVATPYDAGYVGVTDPAAAAFDRVLNYVGANWWTRDGVVDTVDERIIAETGTGTGQIIAWADNPADPNDGTEWNALKNAPLQTRPPGWDTDHDGMPDAWEVSLGLDPAVANQAGDFDSDGYTDLEEYLFDLTAWPAPAPAVFAGGSARYALQATWNTGWQPSRFDHVEIRAGTVTVDSVGQQAGKVVVGGVAAVPATLQLTAGTLTVAESVVVGGEGSLVIDSGTLAGTPAVTVAAEGRLTLSSPSSIWVPIRRLVGIGLLAPGNGGWIDLGVGGLEISAGGISAEDLRAGILAGRGDGTWNGTTGIGSAVAAASGGARAVGYLVEADGTSRAAFTAPGDVDLDGVVNVFDLVAINGAATYGRGTPADWSDGDFNYDGVTNVFDLVSVGSAAVFGRGGFLPSPNGSATVTAVPEPGAILTGAGSILLWAARRGRRRAAA
jgi:hypothetical protein